MTAKMTDWKAYFKGKKITIMGLGVLGRAIGITQFLASLGAELTVTDLKSVEQLRPSIIKLKKYPNIKYTLGKHKLEDFKNRDIIIKSVGVPLDSIYIKEAKKNKIPIEMDVSLFWKLAPEVKMVGVTGTRGKSTVTQIIFEILTLAFSGASTKIFLGGNVRGVATLPLLEKVKAGDVMVAELDSWLLQGFGDSKMSPNVSVFTNLMPDHMNYYKGSIEKYFKDKTNIFKYQNKNDFLIVGKDLSRTRSNLVRTKGKILLVSPTIVPKSWKLNIIGEHNLENIACAILACRALGISEEKIKKGVESFEAVQGRLELLRNYKGVKIYNDNNATTFQATAVAIKALKKEAKNGKVVLIMGGSSKGLDPAPLLSVLKSPVFAVVLLPGTGTDEIKGKFLLARWHLAIASGIKIIESKNLKDAVQKSLKEAKKGDTILFSPAFASFGLFKNEYDRNDQFVKIIKNLK